MSRKGNCLDNCIMENFFGKRKNEMFYGHAYEFQKKRPDSLPSKKSGRTIFVIFCPKFWGHYTCHSFLHSNERPYDIRYRYVSEYIEQSQV